MALDSFPKLVAQYGIFMDRGTLYGAYKLAREFRDEARGEAVIERLVYDSIQKKNLSLAGRLRSACTLRGISSIFDAVDTYETFISFARDGRLPAGQVSFAQGQLPTNQASEPKEGEFLYKGAAWVTAAALLVAIGLFATGRNPPKVSYNPDKVPVAATYPNTPAEKFLALREAGWVYDGDGHFKRIVEDGDNRGVSGIVVDAYRKLGSKTQMDAERAALLADEIIHTEGSQVKRKGKKGNMGDLRNPKKNIIKEDAILRAHASVLSQLFN